jgi:hypothetical protein
MGGGVCALASQDGSYESPCGIIACYVSRAYGLDAHHSNQIMQESIGACDHHDFVLNRRKADNALIMPPSPKIYAPSIAHPSQSGVPLGQSHNPEIDHVAIPKSIAAKLDSKTIITNFNLRKISNFLTR